MTLPEDIEPPYPNRLYAWFVVFVLLLLLSSSFVDRTIISLLVGPIRADLDISDTEFSLLQGFAFALLYAVLGLPAGMVADRRSRKMIIFGGVGMWSIATVSCGLARSFWQLFASRVSVGIGEAALTPSAMSLIADYFPKDRLATALSIYQFGSFLGQGLALIIGGVVIQLVSTSGTVELFLFGLVKPWQAAFIAVGLPGLLLALLALTIREPVRRGRIVGRSGDMTLGQTLEFMGARWKIYGPLILGVALASLVNFSLAAWVPAMLMRSFGWSQSSVGQTYGTVILVAGGIGAAGGGNLADWLVKRGDVAGHVTLATIIFLLIAPFVVAAALAPSAALALVLLFCTMVLFGATPGVTSAILQVVTPNEARGKVISIHLLAGALIGAGMGPTVIAALTDTVYGGGAGVRYSIATAAAVLLPAASLLMLVVRRNYARSVPVGA